MCASCDPSCWNVAPVPSRQVNCTL
uniref:Uncharacterized protein n=1 Tax=Anguilla anguilla TaxID=7936 RepID=A0A0E9RJM5_ANGAN